MKILGIVQARLASTRLPGKALLEIGGRPMLDHVLERAEKIPGVDRWVLATTDLPEDDSVAEVARARGWAVTRGRPRRVLEWMCHAGAWFGAQAVARVTGDCPLLDPEYGGEVVAAFRAAPADLISNVHLGTLTDGLEVEVVSVEALETSLRESEDPLDVEHVTRFIRQRSERFLQVTLPAPEGWPGIKLSVDDQEDLERIRAISARLVPGDYSLAYLKQALEAHGLLGMPA